jgi:hypothetical protein
MDRPGAFNENARDTSIARGLKRSSSGALTDTYVDDQQIGNPTLHKLYCKHHAYSLRRVGCCRVFSDTYSISVYFCKHCNFEGLLLLLCGDVETNPGPPKKNNVRKIKDFDPVHRTENNNSYVEAVERSKVKKFGRNKVSGFYHSRKVKGGRNINNKIVEQMVDMQAENKGKIDFQNDKIQVLKKELSKLKDELKDKKDGVEAVNPDEVLAQFSLQRRVFFSYPLSYSKLSVSYWLYLLAISILVFLSLFCFVLSYLLDYEFWLSIFAKHVLLGFGVVFVFLAVGVLLVMGVWIFLVEQLNGIMKIFNDPLRHDYIAKKLEKLTTRDPRVVDATVINIDEDDPYYYEEELVPYTLLQRLAIYVFKHQAKPGLYWEEPNYPVGVLINSDRKIINMIDRRVIVQLGDLKVSDNVGKDTRDSLFKNANLDGTTNITIQCMLYDNAVDPVTMNRKAKIVMDVNFLLLKSLINSKTTNLLVNSQLIKTATTQFRNVAQHINIESYHLQIKESFTQLVAFHICNSLVQKLSSYHQNF